MPRAGRRGIDQSQVFSVAAAGDAADAMRALFAGPHRRAVDDAVLSCGHLNRRVSCQLNRRATGTSIRMVRIGGCGRRFQTEGKNR